jgi:hypothetical protein
MYSPTKYVEHVYQGSIAMRNKLIQLLKGRKCHDRFYRQTVEQPDGAVGLLEDIDAAVRRRHNEDRELREELKRRELLTAHRRNIHTLNYQHSLPASIHRAAQAVNETSAHLRSFCPGKPPNRSTPYPSRTSGSAIKNTETAYTRRPTSNYKSYRTNPCNIRPSPPVSSWPR